MIVSIDWPVRRKMLCAVNEVLKVEKYVLYPKLTSKSLLQLPVPISYRLASIPLWSRIKILSVLFFFLYITYTMKTGIFCHPKRDLGWNVCCTWDTVKCLWNVNSIWLSNAHRIYLPFSAKYDCKATQKLVMSSHNTLKSTQRKWFYRLVQRRSI